MAPPIGRREKVGKAAAINFIPNHVSSRFSPSRTNGPRLLSRAKAGTHSAFGEKSHTRAHTAKHGAIRVGVVSLPSDRSARFGNPAWPGVRTAYFAAFGSWLGGAPEERREPRNSDALMRVAVPRRRGPAGLRSLLPVCIQLVLVGWKDLTRRSGRVTITRNNRTDNRLALVRRLRWAVK